MTFIYLGLIFAAFMAILFYFPELSLLLEKRKLEGSANRVMIEEVTRAVRILSKKKISAFLILKRKDDLLSLIKSGEEVNKKISAPLLIEYFFLGSKGKGKAVLENGILRAVNARVSLGKKLLKNSRKSLDKLKASYLTKKSDAIAVLINEKGTISLAYRGNITPRVSHGKVENVLLRFFERGGRILRERKIIVNRI